MVLRDLTFHMPTGCAHTLEGPNGSGKSTLLRLLAGLIRPRKGTVTYRNRGHLLTPRFGYVDHQAWLYPDLSAFENLRFFASFSAGRPPATKDARNANPQGTTRDLIDVQIERFAMQSFLHQPVRRCSRGQKQRISLARALLSRPHVLLLDEPDTGLDEASRARLTSTLREEVQAGRLVVLVTHHPTFAQAIGAMRWHMQEGRLRARSPVEDKDPANQTTRAAVSAQTTAGSALMAESGLTTASDARRDGAAE